MSDLIGHARHSLNRRIVATVVLLLLFGTVASADSVLSYFPPLEQQNRVLDVLREDTSGAFDVERIRKVVLLFSERDTSFEPQLRLGFFYG